jgi:hypothetical protein
MPALRGVGISVGVVLVARVPGAARPLQLGPSNEVSITRILMDFAVYLAVRPARAANDEAADRD